jgi:predicted dehydrogenase
MKTLSRRNFLEKITLGTAATAAAATLPAFACGINYPLENRGDKRLNIALCGLGRYANYVAEGIQSSSEYCRVAGIVTGTPSKIPVWQKRFAIPDKNIYSYDNFDSISKNKDIDLIYVVLPNSMHKEFTIRAAKAGKHVIVEKPMAITVADCQEMIAACDRAGVQLTMGYRLHYEPYNMEIKRLGQEKVFGQVRLIEASLGYKSDDPSQWRLKKALAGGGPLMNLGVYCIQCSRYTLGEEPTSVTAQFGPITNKAVFTEVEESITWQLQFPSGAVSTSTSTYNCSVDRFFASADDGFFELSPAISYGPFKGRTSRGEMNFPTINQQATQCDEIAKVILAKSKLPGHISGGEGLQDVKIMQAIYESAGTGKRVEI